MAQNSVIEQAPLFETLPVGQEIIFIVSNETAVINELRVKFIVDVHISEGFVPDINTTDNLIGTFKVTPNNAGRGVIDLSTIVGNYVSADNMAVNGSSYKGQETADRRPHPLHLIDKYSLNNNIIRYMRIKFTVEYLDANGVVTEVEGTRKDSALYIIWNAYLKETDELIKDNNTAPNINWFGWNPTPLYPDTDGSGNPTGQFLTNAPTVQYANPDDYGTFGFITRSAGMAEAARKLYVNTYNSGGVLQSQEIIPRNGVTGSYNYPNGWGEKTTKQIGYVGVYPGNLRNWSSNFKTDYDAGNLDGGYYTVQLRSQGASTTTKLYTIYLNCPNTKGYESIRLCWLNQWGAWDYYTFTQKSIRSISAKGSTYRQLGGNWGGSIYYPNG